MVFTTDNTATTQEDQNNENQSQETPIQESFLDKLVQAKGENWKDPEVLAKGKLEADGYIKNLEDQLSQMRRLEETGVQKRSSRSTSDQGR